MGQDAAPATDFPVGLAAIKNLYTLIGQHGEQIGLNIRKFGQQAGQGGFHEVLGAKVEAAPRRLRFVIAVFIAPFHAARRRVYCRRLADCSSALNRSNIGPVN